MSKNGDDSQSTSFTLAELQDKFIKQRGQYSDNVDHWRLFLESHLPPPSADQFPQSETE